jgi:hypothetical protein
MWLLFVAVSLRVLEERRRKEEGDGVHEWFLV